jgi:hypothetical protein
VSKKHQFYPEEIKRLEQAWREMVDRRSAGTGSAWGDHYILVGILRDCGVEAEFESSSQVENYVEYVITYREAPDIY